MEILMKNQWVENYVRQWKTYRSPLTVSTRLLYFMSKTKILKIIDLNKDDVLCYKIITFRAYDGAAKTAYALRRQRCRCLLYIKKK